MRIDGQVAIVTGAGRGIGRAVAHALAEKGATIIAVARTESQLTALGEEITALGGQCHAFVADVGNEDDVRRVVRSVSDQIGNIEILVNNAGAGFGKSLIETSADDWDRHMAVNARGVFLFTREVAALMIPRKRGRIVNISSIAGHRAVPGFGAYSASKFAAVGFTEAISRELKAHGIAVYSVCPGAVNTEMRHKAVPNEDRTRIMQPEDIAALITFLVAGPGGGLQHIAIEVA